MTRTRILVLIVITGMLAIWSCSGEQKSDYQMVTRFDPQRDAAQDIELAIAEARRSHRNIILDVGGEWCKWCHRLDEFFESNEDVSQFMHDNYVVVKINYSPENKNESVLARYPEIPGYPHLFVLDSDGNLIHSQDSGLLETGEGHDLVKVTQFLKAWVPDKTRS